MINRFKIRSFHFDDDALVVTLDASGTAAVRALSLLSASQDAEVVIREPVFEVTQTHISKLGDMEVARTTRAACASPDNIDAAKDACARVAVETAPDAAEPTPEARQPANAPATGTAVETERKRKPRTPKETPPPVEANAPNPDAAFPAVLLKAPPLSSPAYLDLVRQAKTEGKPEGEAFRDLTRHLETFDPATLPPDADVLALVKSVYAPAAEPAAQATRTETPAATPEVTPDALPSFGSGPQDVARLIGFSDETPAPVSKSTSVPATRSDTAAASTSPTELPAEEQMLETYRGLPAFPKILAAFTAARYTVHQAAVFFLKYGKDDPRLPPHIARNIATGDVAKITEAIRPVFMA